MLIGILIAPGGGVDWAYSLYDELRPVVRMSGTPSFDMPEPRAKGVMKRIRLGSLRAWNKLLRAFGLPSVIWGR